MPNEIKQVKFGDDKVYQFHILKYNNFDIQKLTQNTRNHIFFS